MYKCTIVWLGTAQYKFGTVQYGTASDGQKLTENLLLV